MSVVNNNLLLAAEDGGYVVDRSVRLRSSASASLSRTFPTAGNRQKWTWSGWVKRGALGASQTLFSCYYASNNNETFHLSFFSDNTLRAGLFTQYAMITNQVFRDPSAWYHIVFAFDSTQATSTDRWKLYVNGVQVTNLGAAVYPGLNDVWAINAAQIHYHSFLNANGWYFDGYLTEVNFIDGQALTPSSFGETDAVTGVWKPKKYAGTYGTNGFFLNFSDPSSTTTIGYDYSGNGNNWTSNNISVTAGVTYDSMIDTPTPVANVRGNFCVLNPLTNTGGSISNGNLVFTGPSGAGGHGFGTFGISSGKHYWEATVTSDSSEIIGIQSVFTNNFSDIRGYSNSDGNFYVNSSGTAYGATFTTNDVIGIALDMDAGTLVFYKNGTSQGTATTGLTGTWFPAFRCFGTSSILTTNFGQRPFAYTPPTGFKALNTQNLPESTIVDGSQHFDVVTRTGNNSSFSVTGLQFSPDFFWTKCRNTALAHYLADTVRGDDNILFSNLTNAEFSEPQYITAISSDGYTLGAGSNAGNYNGTGGTYVDWLWKASDSAAVTNTAGSITSTVSANTTSGFSIVTYTGNGSTSATVGHGLGVAPKMLIVKNRTTSGTNWPVWHTSLTNETFALYMDTTLAQGNANNPWGSGTISSTTFHITATGTGNSNQSSANFVAYCFSEVAGYSRFGSYTGNGSADGPFVFCGFRPKFVMIKRTDSTTYWQMYDTSRAPTNVMTATLAANGSDAEGSFAGGYDIDFVSNGFKPRTGPSNAINTSGGTYIYTAFAENPFKNALAR